MPGQPTSSSWRHRLRLSTSALMIVVLVLGVVFGWILLRAQSQRDAVAAIKQANGHVGYNWEYKNDQPSHGKLWAPEWLLGLLGVDYFGQVVSVGLYDTVSDAELILSLIQRLWR